MDATYRPPRSAKHPGARHAPAHSVGIDRFRRLLNARREEVTTNTRRANDEDGAEPAAPNDTASTGETADGAATVATVVPQEGREPPQTNQQPERQDSQGSHGGSGEQGAGSQDSRDERRGFGTDVGGDKPRDAAIEPGGDRPHGQHGRREHGRGEPAGLDGASRREGAADTRSQPRRAGAAGAGDGGSSGDQRDEGAWCQETAALIGTLCANGGEFECWSATLPLDAAVLPDTVLRLELSPHWLSLRFTTQSAYSARLISSDRDRLQRLLEATPGLPRGIGIELA